MRAVGLVLLNVFGFGAPFAGSAWYAMRSWTNHSDWSLLPRILITCGAMVFGFITSYLVIGLVVQVIAAATITSRKPPTEGR